jgi:hypothetical protein
MEEEDTLTRLHAKHCKSGGNKLWKSILEDEDAGILAGRSNIDLKDKWRNMCNKK